MPPPPRPWNRLLEWFGLAPRTSSLSLPAEEWRSPSDRYLWCEPSPAYLTLYRTQPAVRTVVDFLADNVAQLGIHVFRRISDTDRVRVNDHPLQRLLNHPNNATTRYRLMRDTVADICIYGHAYWLKALDRDVLLRLPPEEVRIVGGLLPVGYVWRPGGEGEGVGLRGDELVHFSLYQGRSPLETLRRRLEEDEAAVGYRTLFWNNGARLSGWLGRPAQAPRWTHEQREQFRDEWRQFQGAANAGKSPVLEDGMEFHAVAATAQDSQLVQTRKLTREEAAALYHVPPAMIGITESQGYGSLREQHRALYQDTLGPWMAMLEDEIELQLLADFSDSDDIYLEFNVAQKLSGSFEEQAAALNAAVGSPWMTRNEARARVNLPAIPDPAFDQPVTRLDLAEGQAAKGEPATPPASVEERSAMAVHVNVFPPEVPALPPPAVDVAALTDRVEHTLRALPREIAAHLPVPPPPPALTRAVRQDGRIVALEECDATGAVIAYRTVTRDGAGRIVEVATVPVEEREDSAMRYDELRDPVER